MTIFQKQHLLAYLELYRGPVDGIWGSGSRSATREFQGRYQLEADGIFGPETEARIRQVIGQEVTAEAVDFWQEIRFFRREEFACKCGRCGGFPAEPEAALVKIGDRIRGHFGAAVHISSGLRCAAHNAAVGGVANSRHLTGKAMDLRVSGIPAREALAWAQGLPGIRYAYAIDQNYIHIDIP